MRTTDDWMRYELGLQAHTKRLFDAISSPHEHEGEIDTKANVFEYVARCSCGWEGSVCGSEGECYRELESHFERVEA